MNALDLVHDITDMYLSSFKSKRYFHQDGDSSRTPFYLDLEIGAGSLDSVCELAFTPAFEISVEGGLYCPVPREFISHGGVYCHNRIGYTLYQDADSLRVVGPLLEPRQYPAVFSVVEGMDMLLQRRLSCTPKRKDPSLIYVKK